MVRRTSSLGQLGCRVAPSKEVLLNCREKKEVKGVYKIITNTLSLSSLRLTNITFIMALQGHHLLKVNTLQHARIKTKATLKSGRYLR